MSRQCEPLLASKRSKRSGNLAARSISPMRWPWRVKSRGTSSPDTSGPAPEALALNSLLLTTPTESWLWNQDVRSLRSEYEDGAVHTGVNLTVVLVGTRGVEGL